jgi:hypothetical protein
LTRASTSAFVADQKLSLLSARALFSACFDAPCIVHAAAFRLTTADDTGDELAIVWLGEATSHELVKSAVGGQGARGGASS